MERWSGKVAIVTGASSGIGAAVAEALVEHGLQVVGLARRVELMEKHAKKLSGKPGKLHPFKVDMTNESEILAAFKFAEEKLGPVHILINNAACFGMPLLTGETETWRTVLETNVLGLCIATREAVKGMKKAGIDGHIIHINSVVGHKVVGSSGLYGPSKYAVTALTESLRHELNKDGNRIKISSVSPGTVETEFLASVGPVEMLKFLPKLQAEDVVGALLYILGTAPHVQVHELIIKPVGEPF